MAEEKLDLTRQQVSAKRAVWDLLSHIRSGQTTPIKKEQDKDGRWIVTYTLKDNLYSDQSTYATQLTQMHSWQIESLRRSMRDIEQLSNIRFKEAVTLEERQNADIRILQGNLNDKTLDGLALYTGSYAYSRGVIITNQFKREDYNYGKGGHYIIQHELMHALGLSHPGALNTATRAGGANPLYNRDSSGMSYNWSLLPNPILGIGPFDVLALQEVYGKPPGEGQRTAMDGNALPAATVIAGSNLRTLDLSEVKASGGMMTVNLGSPDFSQQVSGSWEEDGKEIPIHARIVPGTPLDHVCAGPAFKTPLRITGNIRRNYLEGGAGHDRLLAWGGGDVLAGGDGADTFIIHDTKNIITDYGYSYYSEAQHKYVEAENILIRDKALAVQAEYHDRFLIDGKETPGTLVRMQNADGKTVNSVFIMNKQPQEICVTQLAEKDGKEFYADIAPVVLESVHIPGENWESLPSPRTPAKARPAVAAKTPRK